MLLFQQKKIYIFIPSNSFKLSEAPEVNGIKYQMTAEALGLITCAWQGMERKHLSVTSQILHTICGVHAYTHARAHIQSTLTLSPIQNNFLFIYLFFLMVWAVYSPRASLPEQSYVWPASTLLHWGQWQEISRKLEKAQCGLSWSWHKYH